MMEKVERGIDMLRNEQGEFLVTEDFKAKFHKCIVDHHLSKFHCSYLGSPCLIVLFVLQPPSVDPMPVPVGVKLRVLSWNNRKKRSLLGCET
jgi:hypothetical protein